MGLTVAPPLLGENQAPRLFGKRVTLLPVSYGPETKDSSTRYRSFRNRFFPLPPNHAMIKPPHSGHALP